MNGTPLKAARFYGNPHELRLTCVESRYCRFEPTAFYDNEKRTVGPFPA